MTEAATVKPVNCHRCADDRMIANTDEGEPWHCWMELPVQNAVAVTLGIVRPIPCPACNADGKATYRACAHGYSKPLGHNYCADCGAVLRGGRA